MGEKKGLIEYLENSEEIRITYIESGEEKTKEGKTSKMIKFFSKIESDPNKHWILIEKI